MSNQVTVSYLQMTCVDQLKGKPAPSDDALVVECQSPQFELNRFFYQYVGAAWQWFDKANWTEQQWRDYALRDELKLFMLLWQGSPAGYFELERQRDGSVQIAYFGVAPGFLDKGLGGFLLTQALQHAWQWGTDRVWVHTCDLDHPNALANYQARGMTVYKTEIECD
ncbi:GNAT family N-acetyltransferase [Neiella marina]|uniref:GNAT family N-acetyltransferase n=1 Tax=Neiella holothuriorum TaxID=2870530 RepID=A0ABS7EK16_9GAMM|nr:GNAT family N-acetyltransferase [Neiella holothuriorum]MBW8192693.1 GNAT family N-acetyltransferase [Neiella holothuriorum]